MSDTLLPRRLLLALAAAAMLPAAPSWAAKAQAVPTAAEMLAVQAKFIDAIQNAPAEAIAPMMSEKLTYLHASGGKNDKAKQLAMFANQPTPRWIKIETRDITVKPYPGLAILTGDILFTSAPRAGQTTPPTANPYRHTTVWAKEDGVWRLVNWQINTIVQAPPAAPASR
jgi:ketosteroid isomerase-like protein